MLTIRADPQTYTFGWAIGQAAPHTLATGETRYLANEVAGGFTGVYFALYATGNGKMSRSPTYFDWFDYHILEQQ
jgi:xylan 1,4-beta-xylosidase